MADDMRAQGGPVEPHMWGDHEGYERITFIFQNPPTFTIPVEPPPDPSSTLRGEIVIQIVKVSKG
jgi:hypothetical protein